MLGFRAELTTRLDFAANELTACNLRSQYHRTATDHLLIGRNRNQSKRLNSIYV